LIKKRQSSCENTLEAIDLTGFETAVDEEVILRIMLMAPFTELESHEVLLLWAGLTAFTLLIEVRAAADD
jgi:hypothetical protein